MKHGFVFMSFLIFLSLIRNKYSIFQVLLTQYVSSLFIFELLCDVIKQITFNGLLICTLISENQGLEKSRSTSNLRKISCPANLDFFSRSPPRKKLDLYHKPEKIQVTNWKKIQVYWKKIQFCRTWKFSKV